MRRTYENTLLYLYLWENPQTFSHDGRVLLERFVPLSGCCYSHFCNGLSLAYCRVGRMQCNVRGQQNPSKHRWSHTENPISSHLTLLTLDSYLCTILLCSYPAPAQHTVEGQGNEREGQNCCVSAYSAVFSHTGVDSLSVLNVFSDSRFS